MTRTALGHLLPAGNKVLKVWPDMPSWTHKDPTLDADHPADQHYDGRPKRIWVCLTCDEVVILAEPSNRGREP